MIPRPSDFLRKKNPFLKKSSTVPLISWPSIILSSLSEKYPPFRPPGSLSHTSIVIVEFLCIKPDSKNLLKSHWAQECNKSKGLSLSDLSVSLI